MVLNLQTRKEKIPDLGCRFSGKYPTPQSSPEQRKRELEDAVIEGPLECQATPGSTIITG